ncbi:MAG: helix-turn-helix domain-containing protein [Planctomycetaceae bacterium]
MTKQELRTIISTNMRQRRLAARMNQADLAKACQTRQAQISLLESGKAQFDDEILVLLGDALGVHPASLMMEPAITSQQKTLKINA